MIKKIKIQIKKNFKFEYINTILKTKYQNDDSFQFEQKKREKRFCTTED